MRNIIIVFITLFVSITGTICAQTNIVQPTIMVVPFSKEGEDIRNIIENDVNKRIVLTKIKEAFDKRGFSTIDFLAKSKAISEMQGMNINTQTDIRSMIIENSGADIYVDAEIAVNLAEDGNSVKVILTAYDTSTGQSLSNNVAESGKFYTNDIGKLASVAVERNMDQFLNLMQDKFNGIIQNGRSITVDITFDNASTKNMSSEVGTQGQMFADEIELWISKSAYKNNYHIQGTTDKRMIFDDVHIPLKDPNTGLNFNINKFRMKFVSFLKSLNVQTSFTTQGNNLYITIL
jgi:hypothetical protein